MQCGRDPAQCVEVRDGQRLLVGFGARHHLEVHDVALRSVVVDGDDASTVAGGQHGGHDDVAVAPQRIEPVEFGLDLVRAVVVLAVHAQDRPRAGVRVLDRVGGVLGQVQQAQRRIGRQVVAGQRPLGDVDVVGYEGVIRRGHQLRLPVRPGIRTSTTVSSDAQRWPRCVPCPPPRQGGRAPRRTAHGSAAGPV